MLSLVMPVAAFLPVPRASRMWISKEHMTWNSCTVSKINDYLHLQIASTDYRAIHEHSHVGSNIIDFIEEGTMQVVRGISPVHNVPNLIEDIHNSWLYCFSIPLEFGTRVSLTMRKRNTCPKFKRIGETI